MMKRLYDRLFKKNPLHKIDTPTCFIDPNVGHLHYHQLISLGVVDNVFGLFAEGPEYPNKRMIIAPQTDIGGDRLTFQKVIKRDVSPTRLPSPDFQNVPLSIQEVGVPPLFLEQFGSVFTVTGMQYLKAAENNSGVISSMHSPKSSGTLISEYGDIKGISKLSFVSSPSNISGKNKRVHSLGYLSSIFCVGAESKLTWGNIEVSKFQLINFISNNNTQFLSIDNDSLLLVCVDQKLIPHVDTIMIRMRPDGLLLKVKRNQVFPKSLYPQLPSDAIQLCFNRKGQLIGYMPVGGNNLLPIIIGR